MSPRFAAAALAAVLLAPALARAQEAPGGREFSTDRPDTTESPYTVERGRLQIESTLVGWSRSHRDTEGVRTDTWEAGTTELRIGLTPRLEANVFLQPYGRSTFSDGSPAQDGPGDITLRLKANLWGGDGVKRRGDTALGLIPFVDIPTDRSNGGGSAGVGGGLIVPFDVALGEHLHLGVNVGAAGRREDPARGYEALVLASASLGVEWSDRWGTYHEIASQLHRNDPRGDAVTLDNGFTFKPRENLQLDAGVNLGLTRGAEQVTAFVGVSARF